MLYQITFVAMEFWFDLGYWGMFLAAFLAATILPLGSEPLLVALLVAGLDPIILLVTATLGNTLGGLTTFGLGYLGKWKWAEQLFKVSDQQLKKAQSYVDKYGVWTALLTWLPGIGDPIALVLGFFKLNVWKVSALMLVGKLARYYFIVFIME